MIVGFRNLKFDIRNVFMASQKLLEWGEATRPHVLAFAGKNEGAK